jgi:outer membrane lipoprotein-sorting protein
LPHSGAQTEPSSATPIDQPAAQASKPLAAAAATEPPTDAENLLDEAIKKVGAIKSVSADLVEKVDMLGQKFSIQGRYLKAPQDHVYLLLEVKGLPDTKGKMLQVCDGVTLWDYQEVSESKVFRKMEAKPILAKLRTSDIGGDLRDQILNQMGFAGPDVLLAGLRKTIKFDQKDKGTFDGKPVWILRGTWKNREGLLGPNSQPFPPLAPLPSYIPSLVAIYLGEDDDWPYKVTLVGQPQTIMVDTRPVGPDGRRIGPLTMLQKPLLTRIDMVYSNVKLNGSIADQEFFFSAPPDTQVEDDTKRILDALEQAATMRAAQKKDEAAKAEDPLLKDPLNAPKGAPPGETQPPTTPR